MFERVWRGALCALAVLVPLSSAVAGPIYDQGIELTGQFYGGATLTGMFSLNQYGYANPTWTVSLGAGKAVNGTSNIPAMTLGSAQGEVLGVNGAPNTIEVLTSGAGNAPPLFYLTFQHALNIGGPDPFVIDANVFNSSPDSGECDGFSCTSSNERLVGSGEAYVPEPAALSLLAVGLLALWTVRRGGQRIRT